ncbi:hypothetical protein CQW23_02464 [Capsicum baccatum]|uniref:Uncharacterized protein n=1 Tax=Capsicum baccatum TaxID=33114 RepID=A0A2G2XRW9_CAPBA|nr:hypothetical protein CQW23_02464 [Capsicum baccatum]
MNSQAVASGYTGAGGYGGGSGDYSGGLGNPGYRMPQSSAGMASSGGYPDGGNYGLQLAYPSQVLHWALQCVSMIFIPLLVSRSWRKCYNKMVDGLVLRVISNVDVKKRRANTSISEIYRKKKAGKYHRQVQRSRR